MEIIKDRLYLNRSWKYLYPSLRVYGSELINYLNSLIKLAVGIEDLNFIPEEEVASKPKMFILLQTQLKESNSTRSNGYKKLVVEFFNFIREQPYYVDDYLYDIKDNCCYHMIVVKFPDTFIEVFKNFISGQYSQMYHKGFVDKYFPIKDLNKVYNKKVFNIARTVGTNLEIHDILYKSKDYEPKFINMIKEDFDVDITSEFISDYDYPPLIPEEVFNYRPESGILDKYFNKEKINEDSRK